MDQFGTGDSVTQKHVQVMDDAVSLIWCDAMVGIYSYRLSGSIKGRNFFTIWTWSWIRKTKLLCMTYIFFICIV